MDEARFVCDASLTGLARWIRAAGYVARSPPHRSGKSLVDEADRRGEILVTSDRRLMERRVIREGRPSAIRISTQLPVLEQLAHLMASLGLSRQPARCMTCGGRLARVEKAEVAPRIPPRTARWKDEYFVCDECGHLYWEGTHWHRIERSLEELRDERG